MDGVNRHLPATDRLRIHGPIQSLTPNCKLCSIFRYAVASWVVVGVAVWLAGWL